MLIDIEVLKIHAGQRGPPKLQQIKSHPIGPGTGAVPKVVDGDAARPIAGGVIGSGLIPAHTGTEYPLAVSTPGRLAALPLFMAKRLEVVAESHIPGYRVVGVFAHFKRLIGVAQSQCHPVAKLQGTCFENVKIDEGIEGPALTINIAAAEGAVPQTQTRFGSAQVIFPAVGPEALTQQIQFAASCIIVQQISHAGVVGHHKPVVKACFHRQASAVPARSSGRKPGEQEQKQQSAAECDMSFDALQNTYSK